MEVLFPAFLSIQGPYLCYTGKGNEGLEVASFLVCCFEHFGNNGCKIMHLILHGWVLEDLNREKKSENIVWFWPQMNPVTRKHWVHQFLVYFSLKWLPHRIWFKKITNWYWFLLHKIVLNIYYIYIAS